MPVITQPRTLLSYTRNGVPSLILPLEYPSDLWHLMRARYYDPSIGRFIQKDQFKGRLTNPQSLNLYPYCVNNPINWIDPLGLKPQTQCPDPDKPIIYIAGFWYHQYFPLEGPGSGWQVRPDFYINQPKPTSFSFNEGPGGAFKPSPPGTYTATSPYTEGPGPVEPVKPGVTAGTFSTVESVFVWLALTTFFVLLTTQPAE